MMAKDEISELVLTLQDKKSEIRALVQELDAMNRKNKRHNEYPNAHR